jgi:hypothetical protein
MIYLFQKHGLIALHDNLQNVEYIKDLFKKDRALKLETF